MIIVPTKLEGNKWNIKGKSLQCGNTARILKTNLCRFSTTNLIFIIVEKQQKVNS